MSNTKCNIYQAKNGGIYLAIGSRAIELTYNQIGKLGIDVYSLDDFSYEDFKRRMVRNDATI